MVAFAVEWRSGGSAGCFAESSAGDHFFALSSCGLSKEEKTSTMRNTGNGKCINIHNESLERSKQRTGALLKRFYPSKFGASQGCRWELFACVGLAEGVSFRLVTQHVLSHFGTHSPF